MVRSEAGLYKGWVPLAHHRQREPGKQSQYELHLRHGRVRSLASLVNVNFLPADSVMVSIRNNVSLTFGRRMLSHRNKLCFTGGLIEGESDFILTKSL